MINFIRWRFGLGPVGNSPRNETSNNMVLALDFDNPPNLDAPAFGDLGPDGLGNSAGTPWGSECNTGGGVPPITPPASAVSHKTHNDEWAGLRQMALTYGLIK